MQNLKKNIGISFRVDESEKRFLDKKILKSGKNLRDFFLSLANEMKFQEIENIEDLQKIYVEMLKEGNNINQIAKALNSNKEVNINQISRILKKHEDLLDLLSEELMKIKYIEK